MKQKMKFPLLHNPYERFKFRVESDRFVKLLSIRFLNEFGIDVAETYPSSVNIHAIEFYRVKDQGRGRVFLEINYSVEQAEFITSATFTYHLNPNPDYITNVSNLQTFEPTENESNQENLFPCT